MKEPLPRCFAEYGYTDDIARRFGEHGDHNKSNYPMNIIDAICQLLFPDFVFKQYCVYHIGSYHLVEMVEIYTSRVGEGYLRNEEDVPTLGPG